MRSTMMWRIKWLTFCLVSAMAAATALASARIGSGRAYAVLGDLPVMHRGRVKPLNSLAVEEVERIHGRPTINLHGPDGKTTASWEPVAALLDTIG